MFRCFTSPRWRLFWSQCCRALEPRGFMFSTKSQLVTFKPHCTLKWIVQWRLKFQMSRDAFEGPTLNLVSGKLVACYAKACHVYGNGTWRQMQVLWLIARDGDSAWTALVLSFGWVRGQMSQYFLMKRSNQCYVTYKYNSGNTGVQKVAQ